MSNTVTPDPSVSLSLARYFNYRKNLQTLPWYRCFQVCLSYVVPVILARSCPNIKIVHWQSCYTDIWPGMAKQFDVVPKQDEGRDFAASTLNWQPFPDSKEALAYLKQHYKLYALTTGSRELAENLAEKLGSPFTRIFSASDVGYSKPDARAFNKQLEEVAQHDGIGKGKMLWAAQSQFHDIVPAQKLGISTMWIERRANLQGYGATPVPDGGNAKPDFHATSLQEFASQVKHARRA